MRCVIFKVLTVYFLVLLQHCVLVLLQYVPGDRDSSVVRAPDLRLKGPGFKSL